MSRKKKIDPMILVIAVLIIILFLIIVFAIKGNKDNLEVSSNSINLEDGTTLYTVAKMNIENTLSSSGQIASELDEKLKLHASYYFEELLVDENVYIKEGDNIIEYTNGTYLEAPYDCVLVSSNLPNEDEQCTTSHYVELQSISALMMTLSIDETDINKVSIGDEVKITITATGEEITGYITKLSEVGTYSSSGSTFSATVGFANNGNLKIGMSATCEIVFESANEVLVVPVNAIQNTNGEKYVIRVDSNGEEENVVVETGIESDSYVEIKSGLSEGESVEVKEVEESNERGWSNFGGKTQNGSNGRGNMPDMNLDRGSMPMMPSGEMSNK